MAVIVSRDIDLRQLPGVFRDMEKSLVVGPGGITFDRALKSISVYLASKGKESFDRAQTPAGAAWKPLKRQRSRKRDKRAKGGTGQKPLRDTGLLMASVTARASRGAVRVIGPLSLEQGTNLHYAGYHQFGTRHIPKREFLGLTDKMTDKIADLVADDVLRQLVG